MFPLQRTLSLGYLRQHPTRSLLVVLSIALGVATLVGTQALSRGFKAAADNPFAGDADLLVTNGFDGVPRTLVERLRTADISGLKAVHPLVVGRARLPELGNRTVRYIGVDWSGGSLEADNALGFSVKPEMPGLADLRDWPPRVWAFVGSELADDLKNDAEQSPNRFTLATSRKAERALKVGTVYFDKPGHVLANAVFLTPDVAGRLAFPEKPGHVYQLNLVLVPGSNVAEVRREVQEIVGDQARVVTADEDRQMINDIYAGLELGFAIGGAGALVVGLFLVYNALAVSVAERRHDIGILRSVGATRGQITRLFLGEAAVLGLTGSLLGLPLGYALAMVSLGPVRQALTDVIGQMFQAVTVEVSPTLRVIAVVAGTATALLAALVPALQAAAEEPADAVRRVPRASRALMFLLQIVAAVALIATGAACAALAGYLPSRAGVFGGIVLLLVGALVATPVLAAGLGWLAQPFFRYLFGLEGRLAADNLVRSPGRTGLVIAALAATGGLLVQTAGFIRSSQTGIGDWIEEKIGADFFVSAGSAITSSGLAAPMNQKLRDELLAVDGVDAVMAVRFQPKTYRRGSEDTTGTHVVLIALDVDAFDRSQRRGELNVAQKFDHFARLREPGTALVSENFAALYGVKTGDVLRMPNTPPLEVLGTVVDYTWNKGTVVVDRAWFSQAAKDDQVDIFDVFVKDGADPNAVREKIETGLAKREALFVVPRQMLKDVVSEQLDRFYQLAYAQQGVVGLVALLGVISALFISVLQRRRELGLLRAVGATRAQVLRSVLAEAALMGVIGATIGLLIGLFLEWYVLRIMILDEAGFLFPLVVPWAAAGVIFALTIVLATFVGLWPAYIATRLRITDAIAYE